jgi:hypothetical protein
MAHYCIITEDGKVLTELGGTVPALGFKLPPGTRLQIEEIVDNPPDTTPFQWRRGNTFCIFTKEYAGSRVCGKLKVVSPHVVTAVRIQKEAFKKIGFRTEDFSTHKPAK